MSQSGKPFKYSQSMDRGNTQVGQTARLMLNPQHDKQKRAKRASFATYLFLDFDSSFFHRQI
jgi:hypothetical protein